MIGQNINVFIIGLDPLQYLSPMDGILRSIRSLRRDDIRLIGVAVGLRQSGAVMRDLFDELIVMETEAYLEDLILKASRYEGRNILAPMLTPDIERLSRQRPRLFSSGLFCMAPPRNYLRMQNSNVLSELAPEYDFFVKWKEIKEPEQLKKGLDASAFPVLVVTYDGLSRLIVHDVASLYLFVQKLLKQKKQSVLIRSFQNEEAFQTSTVMDGVRSFGGWGMVREVSADMNSESWIFLSIQDETLLEQSRIIAQTLDVSGPLTLRFIRAPKDGRYLLESIRLQLPVWSALATEGGVNLPGLSIMATLGSRFENPPAIASSKRMIVFNSIDVPISPQQWLELVGRGGA